MVSVAEATGIIQAHPHVATSERVPLQHSVGRVLAASVTADRDFPPFHRVAMDGIAIAYSSYENGQRTYDLRGMQAAGAPQQRLPDARAALEVMTGAVLPEGCDTVVRYEDVSIEGGVAIIRIDDVQRGQSIHAQGQDAQRGATLLSLGQKISPAEVALLAAVGQTEVNVLSWPSTAIISTGDELVDIEATPLPHQIRRSNSYALSAALRQLGIEANLFHVPDDREVLKRDLPDRINRHQLIILSGGVSQGKFDFIPDMLRSLGIQQHFHQVSQRPGKPLWFGTSPRHTVFALPGNPVSTFMCFHRYVKPWLINNFQWTKAILASDYDNKLPLTYFLQVKIAHENGQNIAYPVPGGGSGDFANLKEVDGFLELLPNTHFRSGQPLPFIGFRH